MTKEGSVKGKEKKEKGKKGQIARFIDFSILVFLFAIKIAAKQRHTSISPQRVKRVRDHRVCSSNIISFELSWPDVARLDGLCTRILKKEEKKKKIPKKKKMKRNDTMYRKSI